MLDINEPTAKKRTSFGVSADDHGASSKKVQGRTSQHHDCCKNVPLNSRYELEFCEEDPLTDEGSVRFISLMIR